MGIDSKIVSRYFLTQKNCFPSADDDNDGSFALGFWTQMQSLKTKGNDNLLGLRLLQISASHTHKTVAERTVQMLCFLTLPRKLHLPVTLYWKAPEKFPSWFCAGNSSSQLYWYYCCWGRRKVLMKVGLGNFALLNAFSYCYGINQTFQMKTQQPCALRLLLSILHYCITLWLHT